MIHTGFSDAFTFFGMGSSDKSVIISVWAAILLKFAETGFLKTVGGVTAKEVMYFDSSTWLEAVDFTQQIAGFWCSYS